MIGHGNMALKNMNGTALKILVALYSVVVSIGAAHSTTISDTTKVLGDVVVTANNRAAEIVPAQKLSAEELEKISGQSVADALRVFTGTQVKDYGGVGGLKTIDVRSMGTNHTGVFYDGVEVGNAQNGTVDLGRFSLDNLENISLYNGQKSGIFQSAKDYASAAGIYLQPRAPSFPTNNRYHCIATVRGGSFATINPSLLWEQKWNDQLSTSASVEFMHTDGRYRFRYKVDGGYDTTAIRKNGDVDAFRAEFALHGLMDRGFWRARLYYYRSERGYPGAIVKNRFSNEDRQWDTNMFAQFTIKKDISWYSLMVNGKYSYDYLHYLADASKDVSTMFVNNRYRQLEYYLSVANRFSIKPWWEFCLSVDEQYNRLHADVKQFSFPRRNILMVAAATSFVFDKVQFQASVLANHVTDHSKISTISQRSLRWVPTAVVAYKPFDDVDFNIRAFYKRIFRLPTLNELYYTNVGHADLQPEYATQYNVGAIYDIFPKSGILKKFSAQADVYYNSVTDKIVSIPTSNFFRWTMLNLGKVRIKGLDLSIQTILSPIKKLSLMLRIGYTYQQAIDVTNPSDKYYRNQIPYAPRNSGSAGWGIDYKGWQLNGSFIYTGERYSSRANTAANYVLPWYTTDISISKRFPLFKGAMKTLIEVNNLFNQQYEVVISYPMPGINFRAVVQYEF